MAGMKRHLRDVKPGTRVHVERDAPQDPYTFSNPPPVMTVEKMVWSIEALPEGSAYSPARWRITYVDGEIELWDHDKVWVSRDPDPDFAFTAQEPPVLEGRGSAELSALKAMLATRSEVMGRALDADALSGNKHLDEGTTERAYWHAGYVSAMRDALRMIENGVTEYPIKDDSQGN